MRPYGDRWATTLRSRPHVVSWFEVLRDGVPVAASNDPTSMPALNFVSGGMTADRDQSFRRTLSAELVDPAGDLVPANPHDLLSTVGGNEVKVWAGYRHPDGEVEAFPQGVFGLSDNVSEDTAASMMLSLQGTDRSRAVSRNKFSAPYVVANGTNGVTAVQALVADRRPSTLFVTMPTGLTVPRMVFEERDDPWQSAMKIAQSFGYEVFFDPVGDCVIQPEPDPGASPVTWSYVEGEEATFTKLRRATSNERAHNGFVVIGESTYGITPARGEAWDTDPNSPTYYLGPYGRYPYIETNTLVSTQAQVDAAAAAGLRRVLGATDAIEVEMVPNYAHVEGDVVYVERERSKVGLNLVMNRLSVPLGLGAMGVAMRERRIL